MKGVITVLLLVMANISLYAKDYCITKYGARSSSINNTFYIQRAINACSKDGGGRVIIPKGEFITGTITMKSNVNLHLADGATLKGSRDISNYPDIRTDIKSFRTNGQMSQLIYADNANNIAITGNGTIDGSGESFPHIDGAIDEGITRPHVLQFIRCNNVLIKEVTMKNSACWMQHYLACENLRIEAINVFNHNNYNNDAMDVDGCKNVIITGCSLDSDDDAITFKSTCDKPCENIVVSNCIISSHCNAIKMGTESNGGFINFAISNCVIKPSKIYDKKFFGEFAGNGGIALEIVDGGRMESITIDNITINGPLSPIFIRLGDRGRAFHPNQKIVPMGSMKDILINNINIKSNSDTGCSITGIPNYPIENVKISNLLFEQSGGLNKNYVYKRTPELISHYPDGWMFGKLPAYGFFVRHVKNITFDNIETSFINSDARPAIFFDDVIEGRVSNSKFKSCKISECTVIINESNNVQIYNNYLNSPSVAFARIIDNVSKNVLVQNNFIPDGCVEISSILRREMNIVKSDICHNKQPSMSEVNKMFERLKIPFFPIDNSWNKSGYSTKASVRAAYSNKELYLQYNVKENKIKAIYDDDEVGVPCDDNCVEFFVMSSKDKPYTNFEFNSIGTCLVEQGMGRWDRKKYEKSLTSKIRRESSMGKSKFHEKSGNFDWTLTIAIPFELFTTSEDLPIEGKSFYANFYKCANTLSTPHWQTWSPIPTLTPSFHEPQFFGTINFTK